MGKATTPMLSLKERDRRWRLIRDLMKQENCLCLLVFSPRGSADFDHYLTNEPPGGVVVFPAEGEPVFLTWSEHIVTAHHDASLRGDVSWITDIRPGASSENVAAVVREQGYERAVIGAVGIGPTSAMFRDGFVPYLAWKRITESLPQATFKDLSSLFATSVLVKSEEEIHLLRRAAQIGESACRAMLRITKPGVSESKIYATVMATIYRQGARGVAGLPMILHSGPDNVSWGLPIWLVRGQAPRVITDGDIVVSELFPTYGGLSAQAQMCLAVGNVDPINDRLAKIARQSYEEGLRVIRPGVRFGEVADAMEVPLREEGAWYLTPLIHSQNPLLCVSKTGVGIEQIPGIERYKGIKGAHPVVGAELILRPGMCFELEPNACIGKHRVNIGGTVIVTERGVEELNKLPTEMRHV